MTWLTEQQTAAFREEDPYLDTLRKEIMSMDLSKIASGAIMADLLVEGSLVDRTSRSTLREPSSPLNGSLVDE